MRIACLLPAAGASSRMGGRDKLLEEVNGEACLTQMVRRAEAAGLDPIVTLPSLDHPRFEALKGTRAKVVKVKDAKSGMSASLRAGALAADGVADGLMILPPDMPAITASDIERMKLAFLNDPTRIVQANTQDGIPGHPVVFPSDLLHEFNALSGDTGAAKLLKNNRDRLSYVALKGKRARLDLDTPEAWTAWRASLVL